MRFQNEECRRSDLELQRRSGVNWPSLVQLRMNGCVTGLLPSFEMQQQFCSKSSQLLKPYCSLIKTIRR